MKRVYVGLSSTCHDPGLALVNEDGEVVFAEATERHTQDKRAWGHAPDGVEHIARALARWGDPEAELVVCSTWSWQLELLYQAYYWMGRFRPGHLLRPSSGQISPFLIEQYKMDWLVGQQFSAYSKVGSTLAMQLRSRFGRTRVRYRRLQHHLTHAAYAVAGAPFDEAAVAVVDGFGEFGAVSALRWREGRLEPVARSYGPGSLGLFYFRLTELCGFDPWGGEEWKVMGLAPYGTPDPRAVELLRQLVWAHGCGVRFASPGRLAALHQALQPWVHQPGDPPEKAADLAASGQQVFVEVMSALLGNVQRAVGSERLVLTGGCALNSSYNGQITQLTPFREVHVPSAPGDDGNAVGAALLAWQEDHPGRRPPPVGVYLGSALSEETTRTLEEQVGTRARRYGQGIAQATAVRLAEGKLVGWAQGRAELGPRALGNRSILADPRRADMKATLNHKVKYRESFRPFAPSILHEHGAEWFLDYQDSPYMERTLRWRPEVQERVPAVVHQNGTGRLQSVTAARNPLYHALISEFNALTGVPVLLNTSFNVMGKPIIHSVEDAVAVFYTTGLDVLVVGDLLVEKEA